MATPEWPARGGHDEHKPQRKGTGGTSHPLPDLMFWLHIKILATESEEQWQRQPLSTAPNA